MATTAERLREIMDTRRLKQKDIVDMCRPFCEKYGEKIEKSHMSQYVNGKHEPDQKNLTILGMALNVSEGWLMGLDVPMERTGPANIVPFPSNLSPAPAFKKVPRIGQIACGVPILAEQNIESYDYVPDSVKCDFTLVCKGDSMINARIYDGDVVCIRAQEEVENGEIAAVMIGNDEATLKRIELYSDHIVLKAENPLYKPMVFWEDEMNNVRVVGKATHLIGKIF